MRETETQLHLQKGKLKTGSLQELFEMHSLPLKLDVLVEGGEGTAVLLVFLKTAKVKSVNSCRDFRAGYLQKDK